MKTNEMLLSKHTSFLGRNGYWICQGFIFEEQEGETIKIFPVTSKAQEGRCYIEVPKADVENFVNGLEAVI